MLTVLLVVIDPIFASVVSEPHSYSLSNPGSIVVSSHKGAYGTDASISPKGVQNEIGAVAAIELRQQPFGRVRLEDSVSSGPSQTLTRGVREVFSKTILFDSAKKIISEEVVKSSPNVPERCTAEYALYGKYSFNNIGASTPMVVHLANNEDRDKNPLASLTVSSQNTMPFNYSSILLSIFKSSESNWHSRLLPDALLLQRKVGLNIPVSSVIEISSSTPVKRVNFKLRNGFLSTKVVGVDSFKKIDGIYRVNLASIVGKSSGPHDRDSEELNDIDIVSMYVYFEVPVSTLSASTLLPLADIKFFDLGLHTGTLEHELTLSNEGGTRGLLGNESGDAVYRFSTAEVGLQLMNEFSVILESSYPIKTLTFNFTTDGHNIKSIRKVLLATDLRNKSYRYVVPFTLSRDQVGSVFEPVGYTPPERILLASVVLQYGHEGYIASSLGDEPSKVKIVSSAFGDLESRHHTIFPTGEYYDQNNNKRIQYSLDAMKYKGSFVIDRVDTRWVLSSGQRSCTVPNEVFVRRDRVKSYLPTYTRTFDVGEVGRSLNDRTSAVDEMVYFQVEKAFFFHSLRSPEPSEMIERNSIYSISLHAPDFSVGGNSRDFKFTKNGLVTHLSKDDFIKIEARFNGGIISGDAVLLKGEDEASATFNVVTHYVDGTKTFGSMSLNEAYLIPGATKHLQSIELQSRSLTDQTVTLASLSVIRLKRGTSDSHFLNAETPDLLTKPLIGSTSSDEMYAYFPFDLATDNFNIIVNLKSPFTPSCLVFTEFIFNENNKSAYGFPVSFKDDLGLISPSDFGEAIDASRLKAVRLVLRSCPQHLAEVWSTGLLTPKILLSDFLTRNGLLGSHSSYATIDDVLSQSKKIFNKIYFPISQADFTRIKNDNLEGASDSSFGIRAVSMRQPVEGMDTDVSRLITKPSIPFPWIVFIFSLIFLLVIRQSFGIFYNLFNFLRKKILVDRLSAMRIYGFMAISLGLVMLFLAVVFKDNSFLVISLFLTGYFFVANGIKTNFIGWKNVGELAIFNLVPLSLLMIHSLNLFPSVFDNVDLVRQVWPWLAITAALLIVSPFYCIAALKQESTHLHPLFVSLLGFLLCLLIYKLGTSVIWISAVELVVFFCSFFMVKAFLNEYGRVQNLYSGIFGLFTFTFYSLWTFSIGWFFLGVVSSLMALPDLAEHFFNFVYYGLVGSVVCLFRDLADNADSSS